MKRYALGREIGQVEADDFIPVSTHTQSDITLRGDQSDYYFSPSCLVFRQDFGDEERFYAAVEIPVRKLMNPSHVVDEH